MRRKKTVYFNGRFLPCDEARPCVLEPGFIPPSHLPASEAGKLDECEERLTRRDVTKWACYSCLRDNKGTMGMPGGLFSILGFGLFETMRAYRNRIIYFNRHIERIRGSARLIGMRFPYSAAGLKEIISNVIKMNLLKDAYVRLALWKARSGTIILVVAKKYTPYSSEKYRIGFSATVSHLRLDENSFLPRIKSTNRLLYQLSLQGARKKGFDEAIILNSRGYIAEGSRSNLFFIKGKTIFTPAQESGCLAGITRELIFDLNKEKRLRICEGNFTIQDLREADEAFFTNSLIGVIGLTRLEKEKIGNGKSGRQTEYFRKKSHSLLKNDK